ncbi:3'-5' exonuclease [Nocardia violaceofusca]|uniref:3'-5' exonuclease n=1 Tax=Nocardia violaceofusca TaxID=941182 RepID=UPI000AAFA865|nr:3'-5' exonuclease [Nocardia violaceofusca]
MALRKSLDSYRCPVEISPPTSSGYPDLVLLDPARGLLAVDVHHSVAGDARAEFVELNRRIEAFRADTQADEDVPIVRVLAVATGLSVPTRTVAGRVLVPTAQFNEWRWLSLIAEQNVDPQAFDQVRAVLFPSIVFTVDLRRGISDDSAGDRAALRVVLDRQQAYVAERDIADMLVLTGPPGSGKTLVLAARARWLAAEHPEWRIQMLCYNKTLAPYLRRLVADVPNVRVNRVWEIAHEFGIRFSYADDTVLSAGLAAAVRAGLAQPFDAVLIDEVQDFHPAWIELAHALLRPGRGGMLLAGDYAQALYNPGDPHSSPLLQAEHLELQRPYRSTRQILSAVQGLDPSFAVVGLDHAPSGPPVDLVWAASWDEQAQCVAYEVNAMLVAGGLQPRDIGILVTQYRGAYGRLKRALEEYEIPYSAMDPKDKGEFDLFCDTVKLLTVHSAKGYEFKAVVLFGLETLPDPDSTDPETLRRARVTFVGATRAMDNLVITYTRDNKFLTRLSSDEQDVARYCWPDDYEEAIGG